MGLKCENASQVRRLAFEATIRLLSRTGNGRSHPDQPLPYQRHSLFPPVARPGRLTGRIQASGRLLCTIDPQIHPIAEILPAISRDGESADTSLSCFPLATTGSRHQRARIQTRGKPGVTAHNKSDQL